MNFPVSGVEIPALYLVLTGFIVGVLAGFYGVGGGSKTGPIMYFIGGGALTWNYIIGTDLANIVGQSIVALRRHHTLGHVDLKLAVLMTLGTIPGIELGANILEVLKGESLETLTLFVSISYILILSAMSVFVFWESRKAHKLLREDDIDARDVVAFQGVSKRVKTLRVPPMVSLKTSGIKEISVWIIILVSFATGVLTGFLGVGGGFVRMPVLVYVLGVPTHVAVGTDLLEIVVSAGYGAFTHSLKGNVDFLMALVMLTGAAIGAQTGASLTKYVRGPRIRQVFGLFLPVGAILVLYTLLTGGALG
ncbi:MAG: sulfite exporter TauE/SafE family protein [Candidatus Geothermarchaeales archaeon]